MVNTCRASKRISTTANLDVSTLKELAKRWNPPVAKGVVKRGSHQALDDILESIEEMRYYRENFLKLP